MKKFLVIYGGPLSARHQMQNATPAEAQASMEAWMSWMQRAGKAVVEAGAPVASSAKVANGQAADTQSEIGGFSILQADSRDAIVALLDKHPHYRAPGGTIEVHELVQIPGM
jgi:hypothetical protein